MPKRSSTLDLNELAAKIVNQSTSESQTQLKLKNPAAVELGRLGGIKGGAARAKVLSASQRSKIARTAARARWLKRTAEKEKAT